MCGICVVVDVTGETPREADLILLNRRGPDFQSSIMSCIDENVKLQFHGSVLWLQGKELMKQPSVDLNGNILLWNGDVYMDTSNKNGFVLSGDVSDTQYIQEKLIGKSTKEIAEFLQSLIGPWCFIYFEKHSKILYFARDNIGRHSLLWYKEKGFIKYITSVSKRDQRCEEVPALGLYYVDFSKTAKEHKIHLAPWSTALPLNINSEIFIDNLIMRSPVTQSLCKEIPSATDLELISQCVHSTLPGNFGIFKDYLFTETNNFIEIFKKAMQRRVSAQPSFCRSCSTPSMCNHSKFAVLFSGGLDSAVIAGFLDKCLESNESIDLLNVSFEMTDKATGRKSFDTPDRLTGKGCFEQLQQINPARDFNFVEINITADELKVEREHTIHHLIAPLNSVLDDSIGCALYFCGRGKGMLNGDLYNSPARIIFSGLGADEQLGGYSRHKSAFENSGWPGIIHEVEKEILSLHIRNLGRDNRVLTHHGRAPRYPYLDEDVICFLNVLPMWKKTHLNLPRGLGDKMLLRLVAQRIGLTYAAFLPKRAIQFGSKIAKLENSKEKGAQLCSRLS